MSGINAHEIIAVFDWVTDAELLKLKLESEGIPVILKDANILQAEPYIATATGGVKVTVPQVYAEKARAIYETVRAYATDKEGKPIVCPNCGQAKSERYHNKEHWGYRLFPFLEPAKYKCLNCGIITRPGK